MSGVYILSLCAFAPVAILTGLSVKATDRYRPQMWVGWVTVLVAMGLLSASAGGTVHLDIGVSVACLGVLGLGTGYVYSLARSFITKGGRTHDDDASALYTTTMYPIQAPLPVTQNAPALAWMWFLRSFAGVSTSSLHRAVLTLAR